MVSPVDHVKHRISMLFSMKTNLFLIFSFNNINKCPIYKSNDWFKSVRRYKNVMRHYTQTGWSKKNMRSHSEKLTSVCMFFERMWWKNTFDSSGEPIKPLHSMSSNPISIRSYWIKKELSSLNATWPNEKRPKKYEKKPTSTVCQFNQMILKRIFFYRLTSQMRLKCCSLLVKPNGVSFRTFALLLVNRTTHVNGNICSQVSIFISFRLRSFFWSFMNSYYYYYILLPAVKLSLQRIMYLYWFFHKKKICMLYNQYFRALRVCQYDSIQKVNQKYLTLKFIVCIC